MYIILYANDGEIISIYSFEPLVVQTAVLEGI